MQRTERRGGGGGGKDAWRVMAASGGKKDAKSYRETNRTCCLVTRALFKEKL